jgi:hypothetical protein
VGVVVVVVVVVVLLLLLLLLPSQLSIAPSPLNMILLCNNT